MCSELNKRDVKLFRGKRIIRSLTLLTLGPFVVFMTFVMVAETEDHVFKTEMSEQSTKFFKKSLLLKRINIYMYTDPSWSLS